MSKKKEPTYDGRGAHRRAIMYMVGHSIGVFKCKPSTSDIAAWMNVSKPTARRHLKNMVRNGELIMTTVPYRKNAVKHEWSLTEYVQKEYEAGRLKFDYTMYVQRVLKEIGL